MNETKETGRIEAFSDGVFAAAAGTLSIEMGASSSSALMALFESNPAVITEVAKLLTMFRVFIIMVCLFSCFVLLVCACERLQCHPNVFLFVRRQ